MMRGHEHIHSSANNYSNKALLELSSLVLNIIRSSDNNSSSHPLPRGQPMSPAGFASLLLGVSLALMLCGFVTFFIGFLLMPWVIGLVMIVYIVGVVTTVLMITRAVFCSCSSVESVKKEFSAWKLL